MIEIAFVKGMQTIETLGVRYHVWKFHPVITPFLDSSISKNSHPTARCIAWP